VFSKPSVEVEVKYNGVSFVIDRKTEVQEIKTKYDNARRNVFNRFDEQLNTLQVHINNALKQDDFSTISKHVYITNNQLIELGLKSIPQPLKDKYTTILESVRQHNISNIKSSQASHLEFLTSQIIDKVKTESDFRN
jgi:uncharacterized protein YycO